MNHKLETWPVGELVPYARNPRKNDHVVDRIASAIREFGFRVPIVAKSDGTVIDGHLRLKAAQKLGMTEVPVMLADDMTDVQIKAFRLSVNKMAELADWDTEMLGLELEELNLEEFNLDVIGFSNIELEELLGGDEAFEFKEPNEPGDGMEKLELKIMFESLGEKEEVFKELRDRGFKVKST